MTLKNILAFFFLFASNVSLATPLLRASYNNDSGQLTFRVSSAETRGSCVIHVRGARRASLLESNPERGLRLISSKVRGARAALAIDYVPGTLVGRERLNFIAVHSCPGERTISNVVSVSVPSETSDPDQLLSVLRQQSLRQQTVIEGVYQGSTFSQPVDIQSGGGKDPRTLVVEQGGKIISIAPQGAALFLDVTDRVLTGRERGLLGLALAPNFSKSGLFYVNYTRKDDGATVISRFRAARGGVADPASEEVLLTVAQPYANHNGGGLAFGPDGFLYIALGDGGSAGDPLGNGQNRGSLLGKILRIDVSKPGAYRIPRSNPFVNATDGSRPEIYAYGMRNPWRISFDGKTLWAGDVGQRTKEEIDIIIRGGNYGWNAKEGTGCYLSSPCVSPDFIDPVYEYGRDVGVSVTGGYVSRDPDSPNLMGSYIFADYVSGRVFALDKYRATWIATEIIDTDIFISTFGKGPRQELFLASYIGGTLLRVRQR